MNPKTIDHRGYTIFKQPQGGFYICGLKVVAKTSEEAVKMVDEYLNKNDKARQASVIKQASKTST